MAPLKDIRLQSATIVETIVALVIILVITTITTTIIVQTTLGGSAAQRQKALQLANKYLQETDTQKSFFDEETTQEGFIIKRVVANYNENPNLFKVTVSVHDVNNKLIEQQSRLFLLK